MSKVYVGSGKSIQTKYGELIKISFTKQDLEVMQSKLDNGWINLNLNQRKEPSPKGQTHYLVVDDWKPMRA